MTYTNLKQAERAGWQVARRGEQFVAELPSGQTRIAFTASSKDKLLERINARAAHRASMGVTDEPSLPVLKTL